MKQKLHRKIYLLGLLALTALICVSCGLFSSKASAEEEFIQSYVEAILNNCFRNDSTLFVELGLGTAEEAADIYRNGIDAEVEGLIYVYDDDSRLVAMTDDEVEAWKQVTRDILAGVRYSVRDAEKKRDGTFYVTIDYNMSKIFEQTLDDYYAAVEAVSADLEDKYTDAYSYNMAVMRIYRECFEKSLKQPEYHEESTTSVKVFVNGDGIYELESDALYCLESAFLDTDYAYGYSAPGTDPVVRLGQYRGIEVEKQEVQVTDRDVQVAIISGFWELAAEPDRTDIRLFDYVYLNFTAKNSKGEELSSEEGTPVLVGAGEVLEDFEENLLGNNVGDRLNFTLKYPSDYMIGEMAGQDVSFEVEITKLLTVPELTDEFVAMNSEFLTYSELYDYVETTLIEQAGEETENRFREAVLQKIIDDSVFSPSIDTEISAYKREIRDEYQQMAESYGVTVEEYIGYVLEMTMEEFSYALQDSAVFQIKADHVLYSIAMAEGLTASDAEISAYLSDITERYAYETEEEALSDFGEENIKKNIIQDKALSLVLGTAVVK